MCGHLPGLAPRWTLTTVGAISAIPAVDDGRILSSGAVGTSGARVFGHRSSRPRPEVAAVFTDGRTKIVATSADGLDAPTDTAVRGNQILVTDGGSNPPHIAQLQAGKINFAALFGS